MKKKVLLFLSLAILGQPWNARSSTVSKDGTFLSVNQSSNSSPTVSLISPAANATFAVGQSVTITANASDSEEAISKVEFYLGSIKIGEDLSSPYSITWTDVPAGSYAITAKAYNQSGASATSSEVTFTVGDRVNLLPVVSIVTPTANTSIAEGETIVVSVNASDPDGNIAKVELFNGSTKIAERTALPYTFNWADAVAGTYTITAKATDNEAAVSVSSNVTITVHSVAQGIPPVVKITSPSTNSTFQEGKVITINADASDSDGTITKVEYYNGSEKIGQELLEPYSLLWNNAPVGTHSITVKAIDNSGLFTISDPITIVVNERNALKEPYHGTPAEIPGRIEAEDFDKGGLNLAYYDDTPDNKGGQYRKEEYVDIEKCAEGGYDIGFMDIGEWLDYTVEVKETGTYELGVRVGSPNTGKVLHIEMDGVDISGPVTVPNTGDWQKYVTVKIPNIELTAGIQTMKIVMDSAEFNLNYVEFKKISVPNPTVSTPYHGSPAIIPGKIEAEDYDLGGLNVAYYDDTQDNKGGAYRDDFVDIEKCAEGGYDIGFMDIGEWLNYTVQVDSSGTYELGLRVGSPNTGKVLHIEMDGVDISGPVTVPNTGDWQKYATVKIPNIQLTAGVKIMKIAMDSAEFNLNYVEFKKVSAPNPTVSTPYHGSPAIIPGRIEAEDYDLGGLNVAYYDDTQDNKGGAYRDDFVDIEKCAEDGYDIGFMDIGEWLNYTVQVDSTGTYELGVRVGSPNTGKVLHIEMDGLDISGPVTVPNTGDWQKYATVKIPNIQLTAGVKIMKIVMDSAEFNLNYVEFKKVSAPNPTVSTPYHGSPAIIPGRIEAEDYDLGGLDIAYYDDTQDNKGGEYRADFVDIEKCAEGGYDIGFMDIGEWLNYTVQVDSTGTYELGVRVGSPNTGKVLHIEMDGLDISGPVTIPNTGDWQKYETVIIPNIQLTAGVKIMKIVMDSAEFNLNYVEFKRVSTHPIVSTPYHGIPAVIPGRIEAEDYDLGGLNVAYYDDTQDNKGGAYRDDFVDIEKCAEGGYDIGYMDIGEWLNYTVQVDSTGTYELGVRVGSPNTGKVLHIEMNGVDISGPVIVPNTGDWQKYATVKIPNIQLTAGVQVMKIVMDSAEFNLNYVEFKSVSTPNPTVSTPYHGSPALIPGRIEAEDYDLGGLNIAYYDDTQDNKGGEYRDDFVDIEKCAEGGYDIGFMDIGEWLNYTVEVASTGTYELGVRVGSPNTGKVLHIEMNGVDISGPVIVPNTGDWQKYATVKIPNIQLTAGVQIMKIVMDSAEFNLNYVEFIPVKKPSDSTGTECQLTATPDASKFVVRNSFADQYSGAGLSNVDGALQITQRAWGQSYLYVIESGRKYSVEAGKAYTISFDFKDNGSNKVASIETGFGKSIEWNGPVNAQPLTSITGTFNSADFEKQSVTFNALSTGSYYLVVKLNWTGQPNAKTTNFIKNISVCEEIAMPSAAVAANQEMTIAGPNPFNDETLVYIPFAGSGNAEANVNITDVYGKPVTSYSTPFEGQLLPIGKGLAVGIYIVTVFYEGQVYTTRVIKN
ncbi:carbohydrate binding family 6 [Sporocytophaga myxococcoides]|uniref:Carbohydrate binding family 6 n=1 Tax=Sporocytophaga myxococcoides TaxID=153721 RepID=A0A098LAQ4_9BACT|nr:carbohydrate-binding protein [Sporocytophaga myxococcoides]GAL84005.1 carbohydrate binding family 6 [Sporocytophaga myxococcoides]